MATDSIDSLSIQIKSSTHGVEKSIDKLADSMLKLGASINGINAGQFTSISNGISKLSTSMQGFTASVHKTDFNKVTRGLNSLASINYPSVQKASTCIRALSQSLMTVGNIRFNTQKIVDIANAMSKLGRGSIASATQNIPAVTNGIKMLAHSLNGLKVNEVAIDGLSRLASAVSKLGSKTAITAASTNIDQLTASLSRMMTELAKAPAVSNNLIRMTEAAASLANATRGTSVGIGTLTNRLNLFPSSVKKASVSMGGLAAAFGRFYATYWLVLRALRWFKSAINLSSHLTEIQNVIDVTFGDMAHKVDELAKHSLKDFGMSEIVAKQTAARFQALGTTMGIPTEKMSDMSIELTKLTGDLASFYDVSQESVSEDLNAIFTGQTRPLRKYGIDLTQATLQQWALNKGMEVNIKTMTQAEKTMLRYSYAMEASGAAHGDFLRTFYSWHNQMSLLIGNFKKLASIVGGVLIGAFKPLIITLNRVMEHVIVFAETVANALGAIFGWTIEIGGGVANTVGEGAEAVGDIASGMSDAKDSAKKMNSYIAGWHEVNNMTSDKDTGSSGGAGGGGLGEVDGVDGYEAQLKQTETIFKAYESEIQNLYHLGEHIGKALNSAMESIDWDGIYAKARNFGVGLAWYLNGLISPELFSNIGTTIAGSLNTALEGLNAFASTFDWTEFGLSIAEGINGFFDTYDFALMAQTLNTWVGGILDAAITAVVETDWQKIGNEIGTFLAEIDFTTAITDLWTLFWTTLDRIIVTWSESFDAAPIETILATGLAALTFTNTARTVATKLVGEIAKNIALQFGSAPVISVISAGIQAALGSPAAQSALVFMFPKTAAVVSAVSTFMTGTLLPAITGALAPMFSTIASFVVGLSPALIGAASIVVVGVIAALTHWEEIETFFTKTFPDWWNTEVLPRFNEFATNVIDEVKKKFLEMPQTLYEAISPMAMKILEWGVEIKANFDKAVKKAIDTVSEAFMKLPLKVFEVIIKAKEKIDKWKTDMEKKFGEVIPKINDGVKKGFEKLPDLIGEVGKNIVTGLWNGINGMVSWITDKVSGFAQGIIDTFKKGFDEHSPSKEAYRIGDFFTIGLGNGIVSRFGEVRADILDFGQGIASMRFDSPHFDIDVPKLDYVGQSIELGSYKATVDMEMDAKMAQYTFEMQQLKKEIASQNRLLGEINEKGIVFDDDMFESKFKSAAKKYYRRTGNQLGIAF